MTNKIYTIAVFALSLCFACTNKNKTNNEKMASSDMVEVNQPINSNSEIYLLVGTYTKNDSKGIYTYALDTITGKSRLISDVEISNPSYFTISKDEKYVYAVSENEENEATVSSFAFDKKEGKLTLINKQFAGGGSPCYISIDQSGKNIVTANYSGDNISVFQTDNNGSLLPASQIINFTGNSIDPKRQKRPHPHCVRFSPDEKYLYATDLGTDKIHKFQISKGEDSFLRISQPPYFKTPDGSGPRHLTFHPNKKYAYLITEISGDVLVYTYDDASGNLNQIQKIKADTLNAQGSADIHISPDGKYLYASNRLQGDGIAIFEINANSGLLLKVGYQQTGIHPRNFAITPNGSFLLSANRDSNNIQIFRINKETGLLSDTKQDISLSMPVCIKFASSK